MPPGTESVVASLGPHRSEAVTLPPPGEGGHVGPVALALKSQLRLFGTVRNDAGAVPAGAQARCRVGGEVRTAEVDASGRFDFGAVPVGEYEIVLLAPRHAETHVVAVPGEVHPVVLASRFGERRITVETEVDGAMAEPPLVVVERREEPRVRREARAPRCSFDGLPPGTYDLLVRADGFLDATQVVEVPADADPSVRVVLGRGGSVRLVASAGAAVAVQALEGRAPPVVALKLGEGTRELRDFGPGTYRFISRAPGELIVVKEIALGPNTPPAEIDLRGGAESTLAVEVRDAAGTPMDDAEIFLETESGFSWNTHARTDARGKAVLDRLIRGKVLVRVERGNRIGSAGVEITPGAELEVSVVIR